MLAFSAGRGNLYSFYFSAITSLWLKDTEVIFFLRDSGEQWSLESGMAGVGGQGGYCLMWLLPHWTWPMGCWSAADLSLCGPSPAFMVEIMQFIFKSILPGLIYGLCHL